MRPQQQRVHSSDVDSRLRNRGYSKRTMYTSGRGRQFSLDGVSRPVKPPKSPSAKKTKPRVLHMDVRATTTKNASPNSTKPRSSRSVAPKKANTVKPYALKSANTRMHQAPSASRSPQLSDSNARSQPRNGNIDLYEGAPRPSSAPRSKQYYILMVTAVVIAVLGIGVSINTFFINRQAKQQVAVLSSSSETEHDGDELPAGGIPDESEPDPSSLRDYTVAPEMPRFIRIPKIGVENRVIGVGVNDQNQLGAPANIFDAGWYRGSALPGERGTALIDGHVSGPTTPGVFKELKQLNEGDIIEIERGSGEVITYEVTGKQSYPYDETDMAAALTSSIPGRNGLNLITCDGKFNAADNNYEDRLIVFAVER